MKYIEGRGTKSGNWLSNELFRSDDISFLAEADYHKMTEILCALADSLAGGRYDTVIHGLEFGTPSSLTLPVSSGVAVGFSGYYYNAGSFGFVANADGMFSVALPEDRLISFETNASGTYDRYDIVQIRPIRQVYNAKSRQFRDPVTGIITSAITNTKTEHGGEFDVVKGDATQENYIPTVTPGWIKIGEVRLAAGSSVITEALDTKDIDNWLGAITRRPQGSSLMTPRNSLVLRDDNGFITVKTPINSGHATTKQYVDDKEIYTSITSDITLSAGKWEVSNSGRTLLLPSSMSSGSKIKIRAKYDVLIKQIDAENQIKFYTDICSTKGINGGFILRAGKELEFEYVGTVYGRGKYNSRLESVIPGINFHLGVTNHVVSRDGQWIVSESIYTSGGLPVWKFEDGKVKPIATAFTSQTVLYAAISNNGEHIVASTSTASKWILGAYGNPDYSPVVLSSELTLPVTITNAKWAITPDGVYAVAVKSASPYLYVLKRTGSTVSSLTVNSPPAVSVSGVTITDDGLYIVLSCTASPWFYIYKNNGSDVYNPLATLSDPPTSSCVGVAFSPDGNFLALGLASAASGGARVYNRSGDNFSYIGYAGPCGAYDASSLRWSSDSVMLSISTTNSSTGVFKITTSSVTNITDFTPSSLSLVVCCSTLWLGDYLIKIQTSTRNISWKRVGDSFSLPEEWTPFLDILTRATSSFGWVGKWKDILVTKESSGGLDFWKITETSMVFLTSVTGGSHTDNNTAMIDNYIFRYTGAVSPYLKVIRINSDYTVTEFTSFSGSGIPTGEIQALDVGRSGQTDEYYLLVALKAAPWVERISYDINLNDFIFKVTFGSFSSLQSWVGVSDNSDIAVVSTSSSRTVFVGGVAITGPTPSVGSVGMNGSFLENSSDFWMGDSSNTEFFKVLGNNCIAAPGGAKRPYKYKSPSGLLYEPFKRVQLTTENPIYLLMRNSASYQFSYVDWFVTTSGLPMVLIGAYEGLCLAQLGSYLYPYRWRKATKGYLVINHNLQSYSYEDWMRDLL